MWRVIIGYDHQCRQQGMMPQDGLKEKKQTRVTNKKQQPLICLLSGKLHYTATGYGRVVPPTDELTTILQ